MGFVRRAAIYLVIAAAIAPGRDASATELMYGGAGSGPGSGNLLILDQSTGAGTLVGNPVLGPLSGIAFNSAGELWATAPVFFVLAQLDPDTGMPISTKSLSGDFRPSDLAFQPGTDVLYGLNGFGQLYTIDLLTGVETFVGNIAGGFHGGIAFTPDGTLYYMNTTTDVRVIDPTNASVLSTTTLVGPTLSSLFDGLGARSDGTLFATLAGTDDSIYKADLVAGETTFLGSAGLWSPSDIAFRPSSVPTPATLILIGAGLACASGRACRKQRRVGPAKVGGAAPLSVSAQRH